MKKRSKHLLVITGAQVACVAVGLWVQHQYAQSSVRRAAERQARSDMETLAKNLAGSLDAKHVSALTADNAEVARLQEALRFRLPMGSAALIVDNDWVIRAATPSEDRDRASDAMVGERAAWRGVIDPEAAIAPNRQGVLAINNIRHLASAAPLPDSSGFVVVYTPRAAVIASADALLGAFPALGYMTLLWTCAMLGIVLYLILTRVYEELERGRKESDAETLRRTQNLVRTRDAVILGLAKLADSRDPETGDHLERISTYSTVLASALHHHPKFRDQATSAFVRLIGISSALHDIGKVGIEDSILRKPGGLTSEERARMATHTSIGGECLKEIEQRLGSSNFLQMAREIALYHHERWDGGGYPLGLAGDAIPLAARIVGIVDVYDALSSKRVYKPAQPHDECVDIIRHEAGKHFDPDLVDAWLQVEERFRQIAEQYQHAPPSRARGPDTPEVVGEAVSKRQEQAMLTAAPAGWDQYSAKS